MQRYSRLFPSVPVSLTALTPSKDLNCFSQFFTHYGVHPSRTNVAHVNRLAPAIEARLMESTTSTCFIQAILLIRTIWLVITGSRSVALIFVGRSSGFQNFKYRK